MGTILTWEPGLLRVSCGFRSAGRDGAVQETRYLHARLSIR